MDLMGDVSHIVVGLYSMNDGVRVGSHQERGKSYKAAQFENALGACLFKRVYQDYSLIFPHVHHGMLATEMIDAINDSQRVSFGR